MQGKDGAQEIAILRLLKAAPEGHISGQELSKRLGVSRTAVWKHINALKRAGFDIEASPSKGYRLGCSKAPFNGLEISSALKTETIGRPVYFFSEIGSTNVKAFELARAGEPEGTVVVAEAQTAGKGRIGRRWESPPGLNLYVSIVLRPDVPPYSAQNLTFLSAVALAETVSLYTPERPEVKWPNDILLDGRKAAGILLEMDSEPDRVHFVIAGIGVNVNMREGGMPAFLRPIATSIAEKRGGEVDRAEFACSLFSAFEKWYKIYLGHGFGPVLEEWKKYFGSEGKAVKVTSIDRVITGICAGVDDDGALLLRTQSGVERIISGDVEAVREA